MSKKFKIGILGGGQLGMMLIEAAKSNTINSDIELNVLEPDTQASCRDLADNFINGDFQEADTVYNFGKEQDVVTIEIEKVSIKGLEKLESAGVKVIPPSKLIKTIQDKGLQKQFLIDEKIPTAPFEYCNSKLPENIKLPIVQKVRKGGYDGYGVKILKNNTDLALSLIHI